MASGSILGILSFYTLAVFVFMGIVAGILFGWIWFAILAVVGTTTAILLVEPPIWLVFWLAKKWGYDGVEILLTKRVIRNLENDWSHIPHIGSRFDLELSFHQPWDIPDMFQQLTVLLGVMPPAEQFESSLRGALKNIFDPVVVHSNRAGCVPLEHAKKVEFEVVDQTPLPKDAVVVVDTLYSLTSVGLEAFNTIDAVVARWQGLIASRPCSRLHLYNYRPDGGALTTKNRPPFDGVLPARELLKMHDWGVIVLELNPIVIILNLLWAQAPTKARMMSDN